MAIQSSGSSQSLKTIFSAESLDEEEGRKLAKEAQSLARQGLLGDAADKMEEAFNQCPSLREKFEFKVPLWRRGICM